MHFDGVDFDDEDRKSSEARYYTRIKHWEACAQDRRGKWVGKTPEQLKALHDRFWLLHNVVAHPLLGLFPCDVTVWFHDVTSAMLNEETDGRNAQWNRPGYMTQQERVPVISDKWTWFVHNVIAHIGIGLFPGKSTFDYHDKTAQEMGVPGWL